MGHTLYAPGYGPTLPTPSWDRRFSHTSREIFFFIIQTYNTTLLYLLLSKPTFHPIYLCREDHSHAGARLRALRTLGQLVLVVTIIMGVGMVVTKGEGCIWD
jgi:15-cis-phytoene synthase/lycopene beta-cyclase